MTSSKPGPILQPFRPRARVLRLLGDELIGNPRLAVFELIKNAYDADANTASVTLDLHHGGGPRIIIEDDGEGMSLNILRNVWLSPGDDYRRLQRQAVTGVTAISMCSSSTKPAHGRPMERGPR